jgi:hypothetical protein
VMKSDQAAGRKISRMQDALDNRLLSSFRHVARVAL